ncbi:MAG: Secretion system C-terminal sorting domain, partial [Bacteroidota bacterium]
VLPNEVYFHCLLTNADATTSPTTTTDLQMAVLAQDNSDTDNSTAELLRTGSNTYAWFTSRSYSPAIRLIVGERVSVDEINDGKLGTFKLFPNPAVTHAQIQYTMTSPAAIAYEIRDVQGKLVTYANVGIKPEGQHSIDIPLDKLNNGHYQVSLVVAGKKLYSKSLQVNK